MFKKSRKCRIQHDVVIRAKEGMVRIARIFNRYSFSSLPSPSSFSRTKNTGCLVISPIPTSLPLQFFFVASSSRRCTPRVFGRLVRVRNKNLWIKVGCAVLAATFYPDRFARDYVIILPASRTFPFEPRNEFFDLSTVFSPVD